VPPWLKKAKHSHPQSIDVRESPKLSFELARLRTEARVPAALLPAFPLLIILEIEAKSIAIR
jgi:hypothetical protein